MSDREDVAWAAGLFEGEGSFCTQNDRYLRCTLQTTDLDVLERFHGVVGFGAIYTIRPDPRNPNGRQVYQWSVGGEATFRALRDMFAPHLGARRLGRASELLAEHGNLSPDQEALAV